MPAMDLEITPDDATIVGNCNVSQHKHYTSIDDEESLEAIKSYVDKSDDILNQEMLVPLVSKENFSVSKEALINVLSATKAGSCDVGDINTAATTASKTPLSVKNIEKNVLQNMVEKGEEIDVQQKSDEFQSAASSMPLSSLVEVAGCRRLSKTKPELKHLEMSPKRQKQTTKPAMARVTSVCDICGIYCDDMVRCIRCKAWQHQSMCLKCEAYRCSLGSICTTTSSQERGSSRSGSDSRNSYRKNGALDGVMKPEQRNKNISVKLRLGVRSGKLNMKHRKKSQDGVAGSKKWLQTLNMWRSEIDCSNEEQCRKRAERFSILNL